MPEPLAFRDYDPAWPKAFEREKARIKGALGELTEGGLVENIAHIGSTSVPGLAAKPCIDILVAAWPFPLPAEAVAALGRLGYEYRGENGIPGREYFSKGPHEVHLHVVESGSDLWTHHLLFRDYLQSRPEAARAYGECKRALAGEFGNDRERYQDGKAPFIEKLQEDARRWHLEEVGFAPVLEAAAELAGFSRPWAFASGWALDLHLGRVSRVHHDVDLAIFRADQLELQDYMLERGWKFVTPFEGRLEPWPRRMRLEPPRHQAHAHKEGRFLDFLLSEVEGPVWRFRREPAVVRVLERLTLRRCGLRYLAPEVALLHKSAHAGDGPRAKDQADFEMAAPTLEPEPRAWLCWALETYRPGHPWLEALQEAAPGG